MINKENIEAVTLPVMEHFYTLQGEGFHQGKAAYFIRLGGCDVGCVWCDVKDSWDADKHPKFSIAELVTSATASGTPDLLFRDAAPPAQETEGGGTHVEHGRRSDARADRAGDQSVSRALDPRTLPCG